MNLIEENIWVEKYRPSTLEECILPDSVRTQVEGMFNNGFTHLLLCGPAGTGKTTLAHIIRKTLEADHLFFNGSSGELNIDALRNRLDDFGHVGSIFGKTKMKFVIIDEADGISKAIQHALRPVMEKYKYIRFILTCNHPDNIIDELHSRCSTINYSFDVETLNKMVKQFAARCMMILNKENVDCDPSALIELIKKYYPDNRKIINELQRYSMQSGKIDKGILEFSSASASELFELINNKSFVELKNWLERNDLSSIFNVMYKHCEGRIPKEQLPAFLLSVGKYQDKHGIVPSRSLNVLTAIIEFWSLVS